MLHEYQKDEAKARRMIVDGVRDHIVPHLAEKDTTKKMWDAINKLFQGKNMYWKMILREKLKSTKQNRGENVVSYFTHIRTVKDELVAIGENVEVEELSRTTLNRFLRQN